MYSYSHPRPAFTVDAIVLCRKQDDFQVLLIRRGNEPFKGKWALPGGFIDENERIKDAVKRELYEETGLKIQNFTFTGLYDKPGRDPRGRTITAAFLAILDDCLFSPKAADDAAEARWFSISSLPPLDFDHEEIIKDARTMLKPSH